MHRSFMSKLILLLSVFGFVYSGLVSTDPAYEYFSVNPSKYVTWGKQNAQGKYDVYRYDTSAGCVRLLFTSGSDFGGTVVTLYPFTYYLKCAVSDSAGNCQIYRSHYADQAHAIIPNVLFYDFTTDYNNPTAYVGVQNPTSSVAAPTFFVYTIASQTSDITAVAPVSWSPIGHTDAFVIRVRVVVTTSIASVIYQIFWLEDAESSKDGQTKIYTTSFIPLTGTFTPALLVFSGSNIVDFFIESTLGVPTGLIVSSNKNQFALYGLDLSISPLQVILKEQFSIAATSTILSFEASQYFLYYSVQDTNRLDSKGQPITFIEKYDRMAKIVDIDPAVNQYLCNTVYVPPPTCSNLLQVTLTTAGTVLLNGKTYTQYVAVLNYLNPLQVLQLMLNVPASALGNSVGFTVLPTPDGSTIVPTGLLVPGTPVTLNLLVPVGNPPLKVTPTVCLPAVVSNVVN